MKILVTGGTGFLGSRLIPQLGADGHHIVALTRSGLSRTKVEAMGATPIFGDLESDSIPALPAIDAVVHAAARFRFSGQRKPFFDANVVGTSRLLKAVRAAGAKTFVFISAAGIVMDERGSPTRDVDEDAPTYPQHFSAYLASKARAERHVLNANEPGFRTIALRPPAIWGPGDPFSRALPTAIKSKHFAFVDRGEYPFATCYIDNVVEAVGCALVRGDGGRAYFISDQDTLTFRQFVAGLADLQGLSIDGLRSMPYWLASGAGRALDSLWAITGKHGDPPISRSLIRMIGREFSIDDSAARSALGYVGKVLRTDGLRRYRQYCP